MTRSLLAKAHSTENVGLATCLSHVNMEQGKIRESPESLSFFCPSLRCIPRERLFVQTAENVEGKFFSLRTTWGMRLTGIDSQLDMLRICALL